MFQRTAKKERILATAEFYSCEENNILNILIVDDCALYSGSGRRIYSLLKEILFSTTPR